MTGLISKCCGLNHVWCSGDASVSENSHDLCSPGTETTEDTDIHQIVVQVNVLLPRETRALKEVHTVLQSLRGRLP